MSTTKLTHLFPEFPIFKRVELSERVAYEYFYKQFEPYSDFSFNNLWVWFNQGGGLAFSIHGENLVIRLDDPFASSAKSSVPIPEYTILGKQQCSRTFYRVLRWQRAMGLEQKLVMIPAECVTHLPIRTSAFRVVEDPDNSDYIYNTKTLYEAAGHEYSGLRRSIATFNRMYGPDIVCKDLDLSTHQQRVNLINHIHRWETAYRQDRQAHVEGMAINMYLQSLESLPSRYFGIYVKDELVSFVIYHLAPQGKFGMLNHIKCNYTFKNISDYTMHAFAGKLCELKLQYENFEQDLGLVGLRKYKQSLRPAKLLKRYTITPFQLTE